LRHPDWTADMAAQEIPELVECRAIGAQGVR
jgi:hypothetical protein